jgi:hypothetical protein
MSRQWARMVKKNKKLVNQKRLKEGKKTITSATTGEEMDAIYGRSWFLPALFVAVSAFFATISIAFYEADTLLWGTIAAYLVLGFIYYLRKPYLKVGKKQVATKKLGVERYLQADEIESIVVQPGSVTINLKAKNKRWIFTKFQNLYNIPVMAARLKTFAQQNQVRYEEDGLSVDKAG